MKRLYILLAAVLLSASVISAQNFRTGYFLDGYMYKYQLNPAFQGERGFVALPALGGLGVGVESNMSLGTFYYPSDGKLNTFLHPDVSTETFMSQISSSNPLNLNLDVNLLAAGFRVKNTYHTIEFSLKSSNAVALPGDVFRFFKVGGSEGSGLYDLSTLNVYGNAYSQLAYGFSIKIKDFISVGLRAKFLMGLQLVQSDVSSFHVNMTPDKWTVNAAGGVLTSPLLGGLMEGNQTNEQTMEDLSNIADTQNFGAAFDLGVSVDFLKHFTASASILDLGFISWQNLERMKLCSGTWEFTGVDNIGSENNSNPDFESKFNELGNIFKFEPSDQLENYTQQLGFTTMIGLEFRMPFYERMSVGALATHRFEGASSWTEGRFSLNLAPLRWLSMTGNYAISTFGQSYGAALNIHPKGFNLFLGLDSFKPLLNVTPEFIPIDEMNTNLKFGITFPFGKYNGRYPKVAKNIKTVKNN